MSESIIESYSPREMERYLREELGVTGVVSSAEEADVLITLERHMNTEITSNDLPGRWVVARKRNSNLVEFYEDD